MILRVLTISKGNQDCIVSATFGYFFWWVWPRVQLCFSSVAPTLVLLVFTTLVLVHSLRLRLRHRQLLSCGTLGIGSSSASNSSDPQEHHQQQEQHQQELQQDAGRVADARRECVELSHLLPTAFAVALTRVLHLSLLVFYMQDPFAGVISGSASSASPSAESSTSSSDFARARHLSLALLATQLAILSVHAAALPFASLLSLPLSYHRILCCFWCK